MFKEVPVEGENVIGFECSGTLTKADLEGLHAVLDVKLERMHKPSLVIFMEDFESYEDASAVLADVRIDMKHHDDLARVAVVANKVWLKWGTSLADLFTGADLKSFDPGDRDAALRWARGGS
ncbi:MAG TPA: STAS/SEC14 domain-containing protein [Aurantimonas coralicida]|uniref:STAS/SEC14 domain-containing protein n=2 Tax=root TaxID=1 RepID=A0A9C9NI33_9HYPH|nr:STAS/SEC14 domain-containing protein [Aurantimonas marina]HDZ74528.1 STAS/SEC14 domain-containing protein [Aurantimonas coralicida]HEU01720.1 STAS/SEC14 domain-containing protein [Aurantimonas coralicida]